MTKVIVTGGAGFIGSHLVDAFIERGFHVVLVDKFSTGKREWLNPAAEVHETDIRDGEALKNAFAGAAAVFHTAALARVQPSIQDPKTSHDVNVNGTLAVLLAARDAGVKRVVYSASSSAYGNQEAPILSGGARAAADEPLCAPEARGGAVLPAGLPALRPPNRLAPLLQRLRPPPDHDDGRPLCHRGRHFPRAEEPRPIAPRCSGRHTQRRDFPHVVDVVRANLAAMESNRVGSGEVINIGTGRNHSILEVARLVGGPVEFIEPRVEPKATLANNRRARELLGWEPQVALEDGIAELKRLHGLVQFYEIRIRYEYTDSYIRV